ncbi:acyl dehydratase [Anoxybacillus calidus]|jgi:acyl dehydratase|uniref:Acyl dehydratase n=1 Tax=[Anoxybacillus] calidus TaxID=575178 RepID=A0A7V9Z1E8_9BACL|nr:MaoC family dehydratase N-terminal domain-containing protein [Anoxybacillus calidus]MBA2872172.1 acyl dehydratase [Anoxybacillus calidus]
MLEEHIGKYSNKVKNTVERGAVKKFAEAIGDPHPIYLDEETGKKSRYKNNIAPPTFPRVFDYGVIEGLKLPSKGLIHGEQTFHYERPLLVGEEILCYSKVENYYEKKGKHGELGFLVVKSFGEDPSGQIIFTSKQTVIITEAVRKEMIV